MYPTSTNKAFLALGMAPGNPAKLEARAKLAGKNLDDVTIPMGCVKLFKGGRGTALEVEIMPTPEKTLESFKGWGFVPLVLTVDDVQRPKSEEIRKELWSFLRRCRGHNMVPGVAAYYDSDDPTAWPQKVYKELKQDEVWPEFRDQGASGASTATPGRTLPKIVTSAKYNVRPEGGYNAQSMSPALKGRYKEVLAQAANSSLASKTWSSYSTVLKQLPHIAEATGVRMDFPMTAGMIQAVLAYYLDKGLKSATIQGYLASLRNIHQVKGLACPALDDKLVQTILKGAKNLESTKVAESHGVVTVRMMQRIWKNLHASQLPLDTKRMLWAIFTMLFLGSLRPSEALSSKKGEYDVIKTLCWKDVKLLSTCMDGKEVCFLQLTLKQPKTSRTMPTQLVEIPELGRDLCAVRAFRKWSAGRKARQDPETPVFTMANGDLVTIGYVNKVLAELLKEESPRITAKAFRPGLATILARQGATPEELKVLGRWTSKAYEQYIRKGRANNWRGARAQLMKATKVS